MQKINCDLFGFCPALRIRLNKSRMIAKIKNPKWLDQNDATLVPFRFHKCNLLFPPDLHHSQNVTNLFCLCTTASTIRNIHLIEFIIRKLPTPLKHPSPDRIYFFSTFRGIAMRWRRHLWKKKTREGSKINLHLTLHGSHYFRLIWEACGLAVFSSTIYIYIFFFNRDHEVKAHPSDIAPVHTRFIQFLY